MREWVIDFARVVVGVEPVVEGSNPAMVISGSEGLPPDGPGSGDPKMRW